MTSSAIALVSLLVFALVPTVFAQSSPAPSPAPAPILQRRGPLLQLHFEGLLASAPTPSGPWTTLSNALIPLTLPPSPPNRFFRSQPSSALFSTLLPASLQLAGPFQIHFDRAFAGTPDGIFPPKRETPYFDATVSIHSHSIPASLRVRGNSSLQECSFPKLKLKIAKNNRPNTPFADVRELKIGTHCADGGRGNIGRLRDEIAAYRESLAYDVMQSLGFVSPKTRRARIEYHDTSPPADVGNPTGWTVSRMALLLEDVEVLAERLGGRALSDEEIATLRTPVFSPQTVINLHLLESLLGNWDYSIDTSERGLWNIEVIELASKELIPVAGDFDLASWITEITRLSTPRDYQPSLPPLERQMRYNLERLHTEASPAAWTSSHTHFLNHQAALESLVESATLDSAGRENAQRHLAVFFKTLAALPPKK